MTFKEKLERILIQFDEEQAEIRALDSNAGKLFKAPKAVNDILTAIKEIVPEERDSPKGRDCKCYAIGYAGCSCHISWADNDGFNECRNQILKRLEE